MANVAPFLREGRGLKPLARCGRRATHSAFRKYCRNREAPAPQKILVTHKGTHACIALSPQAWGLSGKFDGASLRVHGRWSCSVNPLTRIDSTKQAWACPCFRSSLSCSKPRRGMWRMSRMLGSNSKGNQLRTTLNEMDGRG